MLLPSVRTQGILKYFKLSVSCWRGLHFSSALIELLTSDAGGSLPKYIQCWGSMPLAPAVLLPYTAPIYFMFDCFILYLAHIW